MRNLLLGMRAVGDIIHKQEICEAFRNEFNVNLNSEKYANGKLEEKWNLLIQDCTVSKSRENWSEYIYLFEDNFFDLLYKDRSRLKIKMLKNDTDEHELKTVYRDEKTQGEVERENRTKFEKLIYDFVALLDNYWIYEADVWLNAWLVIKYQECQKQRRDTLGKSMYRNTVGGTVLNDKGEEHKLPFEDAEGGYFGSIFLKNTIDKKGCLFWTELDKDESIIIPEQDKNDINSDILYRADIILKRIKSYKIFSYKKIQELEVNMEIEDKILLHKTVDGILLRNMVNKMLDGNRAFEVENYVDLVDELCGCKSLVWQNLIGCIYVLSDKYKIELNMLDFYDDVCLLLNVWLMHIKTINYKLRILTEGFLYLYEKNECNEKYVGKRCEEYLSGLELDISDSAKGYWDNQNDELKVDASVLKNHNEYCWIYAILQRRAIDTIKFLYREDKFIEEPQDDVIKFTNGQEKFDLTVPYKIVNADCFQADIKGAIQKITKQE